MIKIVFLLNLQHRGIQIRGWCPAPAAALRLGSCSLSQKTDNVDNTKDRNTSNNHHHHYHRNNHNRGKEKLREEQTQVFHING